MPTYQYECFTCNVTFETFKTFEENKHANCPYCGSEKTGRKFTPIAVVYSGEGFTKRVKEEE